MNENITTDRSGKVIKEEEGKSALLLLVNVHME